MKKLLRYTSWNWSMGWIPATALLSLGAVIECVLLFAAAGMTHNAWSSYDELVSQSGILWVAAVVYMLLPLGTQLYQSWAGRRTASVYTTLTLPLPRWQIFAVRALSTAFWLIVGTVVQLLLLSILWGPVTALQDSVAAGYFLFDITAQGRLWWDLADCSLFRLLLPTGSFGITVWLGLILAPALMSASVASHSGRRQVIAGILALFDQAVFALLGISIADGNTSIGQLEEACSNPATLTALAAMAAVVCVLSIWGLFALYRSEPAA